MYKKYKNMLWVIVMFIGISCEGSNFPEFDFSGGGGIGTLDFTSHEIPEKDDLDLDFELWRLKKEHELHRKFVEIKNPKLETVVNDGWGQYYLSGYPLQIHPLLIDNDFIKLLGGIVILVPVFRNDYTGVNNGNDY